MDFEMRRNIFCSGVVNINSVAVLVLMVHFVKSDASSNNHIVETRPDEYSIPCFAESSLIFNGSCIQCIRPNHFLMSCLGTNKTTSKSYECSESRAILMCSMQKLNPEQVKINMGRRFLNGRVLQVVTIERLPFVKVAANRFSGIVIELLHGLQNSYNFTCVAGPNETLKACHLHISDIFLPYDGNWGAEGADGSWNGMIGQVLRNDADVGAAGFSVTLERAKVIDFSMSFHQEPAGILIPAPRPGNKLTILVRPLSTEVWLAVFTTVCVLVPSLFVMHVASLRIRREVDTQKPINAFRLIGDLVQFIIGSLVQESLQSPVKKTSRFLIVMWWFLTLILSNVYVGYMVSFLSAPKLFDIVDSLEGLLHQNALRWTFRKNTALEDLFQSNTSAVYTSIGLGARDSDLVLSDMAGLEKVLTGQFAFLKEKSFLDVAIGTDFEKTQKCRITVAKGTFFTAGFALIVHKGSPILKLLDTVILNVVTTGLMEKWKSMHWPRNLWCVNAASYIVSTQPKTRKLTMDDCQGDYLILVCGLLAAIVAFIFEMYMKFRRKSENGNIQRKFLFKKGVPFVSPSEAGGPLLNGVKIIVIPVKEEYYNKLSTKPSQKL